jgi:hypothetical protein
MSAADLFLAFPDLVRMPAGSGAELILTPFDRGAHLVPRARAEMLAACQGFATLDGHAAALAARGFGDRGAVRSALVDLAGAGLLVPAGELVRRARAGKADAAPPPPVAVLGLPTRDRPDDLRAALESHLGALAGRAVEVVIAEGEVSPEAHARTRTLLAEIAARFAVPVYLAGFPERAAYARALATRAGVDEAIAAFALLNPERGDNDAGANGNALLLHAVGDLAVFTDDDTRARLRAAPESAAGLALSSSGDPGEAWFPAPGEPAVDDGTRAPIDLLGAHETLLGRGAGSLVEERRRAGLDLERAGAGLFRRLARGGAVRFTQNGAAGDTGTGSMGFLLHLQGRTRERLHASEATYRHAFAGRQIIRCTPRATIGDAAFCMSLGMGVDARALLPPFFPVQRNADGVFGLLVRACFPDALSGFAPFAEEHVAARRSSFDDLLAAVGKTWSGDLICALIGGAPLLTEIGEPRANLRALGDHLARLGSLPPADFAAMLGAMNLRGRALDLGSAEDLLRRHPGPAWWVRDVARLVERSRASLTLPAPAWPADLEAALGLAETRHAFPRMIRRFGELLSVWPALWDAAAALRAGGIRPGVRVQT